ncbi:kin of IRRE-like protein 1 isoform X2 [Branchiostoma floridae x Branchiostoma japonicum]
MRLLSTIVACLALAGLVARGSAQDQSFREEPDSVAVRQGETVTLTCAIDNVAGIVQWTKDNFALGSDRALPGYPRFTITGDVNRGQYNLLVQDTLLEDDGTYQCQASPTENQQGIRSQNAQLTIYLPPDNPVIEEGSSVSVIAGQPKNVTCRADNGKPAATLTWWKDGQEITEGITYITEDAGEKRKNGVSILTLNPSVDDHGKVLTCQSSNPAMDANKETTTQLNVEHTPVVVVQSDPPLVEEGSSVSLSCESRANPGEVRSSSGSRNDVNYQWKKNGVVLAGENGQVLRLNNVRREDNLQVFTCDATNAVGTNSANITLSVQYGPEPLKTTGQVIVDRGTSATLVCKWSGNPSPTIMWTKKGSSSVLGTGDTLTFPIVDQSHSGTYQCTAVVPGSGEDSREVVLVVNGPPIISSFEVQYASSGDEGQIECLSSNSPPPSRMAWTWNGIMLDTGTEGRFTAEQRDVHGGRLSVLTVSKVQAGDFAEYNCTVWNRLGLTSKIITLRQKEPLPLAAIVGGAVAGLVLILVIVLLVFVFCHRRRKKQGASNESITRLEVRDGQETPPKEKVEIIHRDHEAAKDKVPPPPPQRKYYITADYDDRDYSSKTSLGAPPPWTPPGGTYQDYKNGNLYSNPYNNYSSYPAVSEHSYERASIASRASRASEAQKKPRMMTHV